MHDWTFSTSTGQYIDADTGRVLTDERAAVFMDISIAIGQGRTDALAQLVGGEVQVISSAQWNTAMRSEIKNKYIQLYLEGRGGRDQMGFPDWGSIGGMLREQYRWLDDFTAELDQLSEAQIRARSRMYIKSARESYERAYGRVKVSIGNDEVLWFLRPGEHCPDCETFAALGWQKVEDDPYSGAVPGSGATQCLTNCNCGRRFRTSPPEEEPERSALGRLARAVLARSVTAPVGMRG
jgi:hypothetical protein